MRRTKFLTTGWPNTILFPWDKFTGDADDAMVKTSFFAAI